VVRSNASFAYLNVAAFPPLFLLRGEGEAQLSLLVENKFNVTSAVFASVLFTEKAGPPGPALACSTYKS
jgi:hypothetical protein